MRRHENLFNHFSTKEDVYQKLQDDYSRAQKHMRWYGGAFLLMCAALGLLTDSNWRLFLFLGIGGVLFQYVLTFIDVSNLDFLLHAIDWFEASKHENSTQHNKVL